MKLSCSGKLRGCNSIKPGQEIGMARTGLVSQQCRSMAQHASIHLLGFDTTPSVVILKTPNGNRFRLIPSVSAVKPMVSVIGVDFDPLPKELKI